MKLVDVFKGTKELLSKPKGWTQLHAATDSYGSSVCVFSSEASCFCLSGGLEKVVNPPQNGFELLVQAQRIIEGITDHLIIWWNDKPGRTQQEVIELLDKAIVIAGEME